MKKYSLLFVVLFVLMLSFSAFAEEGEWTAWEPDLDNAAEIKCVFAEPFIENEEVRDILGEVTDDDWVLGPDDAVMTLIEYADFQCPYCSQAGLRALEFQAAHSDEVRYVYRHFPLSFHEKAPMSAYAADAAGQQGLFFEAEKWLYETQSEWSYLETEEDPDGLEAFDAWLRENIEEAIPELDFDQWVTDYESEEIREVVDGAFDKVAITGIIQGTPTFFANFYQTSYDPSELEQYIELFKMQDNYHDSCPAAAVEENKEYRAVLHTTAGDIVIDLFEAEAPNLVSSFMELAAEGFYDGNSFHHVLPGFIAQTGDPSKTGVGLAGYYLEDENLGTDGFGKPGAVAMANTGKDTNSSQFFLAQDLEAYFHDGFAAQNSELTEEELNEKVAARLDAMAAKYSVFGRVEPESLDVLSLIDTDTEIESIDIEVR